MKMCLVEAELLHVDGQAGMVKLTVAFLDFANIPKNYPLGESHGTQ
jgi:hypothetical protein